MSSASLSSNALKIHQRHALLKVVGSFPLSQTEDDDFVMEEENNEVDSDVGRKKKRQKNSREESDTDNDSISDFSQDSRKEERRTIDSDHGESSGSDTNEMGGGTTSSQCSSISPSPSPSSQGLSRSWREYKHKLQTSRRKEVNFAQFLTRSILSRGDSHASPSSSSPRPHLSNHTSLFNVPSFAYLDSLSTHPIIHTQTSEIRTEHIEKKFNWSVALCQDVLLRNTMTAVHDMDYWGQVMYVKQHLGEHFTSPAFMRHMKHEWTSPLSLDEALRQWNALHYHMSYVVMEKPTGKMSLAGMFYLLRLIYIETYMPKRYEQCDQKYMERYQKFLQENVTHFTHKMNHVNVYSEGGFSSTTQIFNSIVAPDGSTDTKFLSQRSISSLLEKESDGSSLYAPVSSVLCSSLMTQDQLFWIKEFKDLSDKWMRWCVYTPVADTHEKTIAFWEDQLFTFDFVVQKMFFRENMLDFEHNRIHIELFEKAARLDHFISLQLYYLRPLSVAKMEIPKEVTSHLQSKLRKQIDISTESSHITKMRDTVFQHHIPSYLSYDALQREPEFYHKMFESDFDSNITKCETYKILNGQFPRLMGDFISHQFVQVTLKELYEDERTFLHKWSVLKVFDMDTDYLFSGWMKKYCMSMFTLGSSDHWRIGARSSDNVKATPLVVTLLGVTYVRVYVPNRESPLLFRCSDSLQILVTFLYSIRMFENSRLKDIHNVDKELNLTTEIAKWIPIERVPNLKWEKVSFEWTEEEKNQFGKNLFFYSRAEDMMRELENLKEAEEQREEQSAYQLLLKEKEEKETEEVLNRFATHTVEPIHVNYSDGNGDHDSEQTSMFMDLQNEDVSPLTHEQKHLRTKETRSKMEKCIKNVDETVSKIKPTTLSHSMLFEGPQEFLQSLKTDESNIIMFNRKNVKEQIDNYMNDPDSFRKDPENDVTMRRKQNNGYKTKVSKELISFLDEED